MPHKKCFDSVKHTWHTRHTRPVQLLLHDSCFTLTKHFKTWLTLFHKINIFQYNFQPNRLFHIPRVLRLNGKYIAFLSPFLLFPFPLHPSYALARWAFCVNAPQPLSKITNNQPPILIHRTTIDFLLCSSGPTVLIFYFYQSFSTGWAGRGKAIPVSENTFPGVIWQYLSNFNSIITHRVWSGHKTIKHLSHNTS